MFLAGMGLDGMGWDEGDKVDEETERKARAEGAEGRRAGGPCCSFVVRIQLSSSSRGCSSSSGSNLISPPHISPPSFPLFIASVTPQSTALRLSTYGLLVCCRRHTSQTLSFSLSLSP